MCSRGLYQAAITLLFLAEIFPGIDSFRERFLSSDRAVFEPFVIAGEPKTNSQGFRLGKKMLFKSTWRRASTIKQLTSKT
ncbi:MAG: hypothetical protein CLLPBCKN_006371 [Chroococcidiopsis cubana SAG 39.79]|uniref:Uncharacterized protein n=1 Tax=Chroococcidiopsis cubana SAG 39.79 TaxID=388085 RepID=A0AB37UA54_9CYAN|nr:hypothetical protein [Chroococcidiopsis cubana]MDZ4876936.1 hypothetical protein [Chroococcidiopsis cubana SAG 39.79]PSB59722.1 hypothetical protein C7B79_28415 [Chroococcidiopsis cubana CCALA 043]RUT02651.1 hypothetical protein DSM107010_62290 [Chroococcidiopsis cubana SAG 39.79]